MYAPDASFSDLEGGATPSMQTGSLLLPPSHPLLRTSQHPSDAIEISLTPQESTLHMSPQDAHCKACNAASVSMPPASLCPTNTSKDNRK